jgi:putative membrane protein
MQTKSILTLSLIVLLSAFGLSACNRPDRVEAAREPDTATDNRNVLTDDERDFIVYAAEMHNGEIAMAYQAKQKSNNGEVRSYADSVIKSHSDALKGIWDNLGSTSKEASWDTKSHMTTLERLSGPQFDQEFVALMVADHQSASDTFREEVNATQNKNLKDYLQQALPGLEKNLRDGRDMQSKLTGRATTN